MSPEAPTAPVAPTAGWAAVLDELELHADAPVLAPGWTPPAGLGPLPVELAPRARDLEAAQQRALRRLTDERRRVEAHLDAVDAVAPMRSRAAYLDLDA